jgi:hypothetical protein
MLLWNIITMIYCILVLVIVLLIVYWKQWSFSSFQTNSPGVIVHWFVVFCTCTSTFTPATSINDLRQEYDAMLISTVPHNFGLIL